MLRWKFILFVISAGESGFRFFGPAGGSMRLAELAFFTAIGLIALSALINIRGKYVFRKSIKAEPTSSTGEATG